MMKVCQEFESIFITITVWWWTQVQEVEKEFLCICAITRVVL